MKIMLDTRRLQEPETAHAYLKDMLGFPDYYGHNLDALYDCLTEISEETVLCLTAAGEEEGSSFFQRLTAVLEDAAEENSQLTIVTESGQESDTLHEAVFEDNAEDDGAFVSAENEAEPQA